MRSAVSHVNGLSSKIDDYFFVERLGEKTSLQVHMKWYGANGAVYRVRLTKEAITRAISHGVPQDECKRDLVMKIVYNYDDSTTSKDLKDDKVLLYTLTLVVSILSIFD